MNQAILSLHNVDIYQDKELVLKEVNIEINRGEFIYLIGKTGSGKSSFIKTLYADLPLKKGNGNIVGFDLSKLKEKKIPYLRRKIGVVFQDFKLLPDRNIYKNLEFVLRATGWKDSQRIKQKIQDVLQKVSMFEKIHQMPHQISGGEQQRVAIARALLNDPEIILADEPTGNLDPQTSSEVMQLLREINQNGKTIIMATHDYALIMKFPAKTIKCDQGVVFDIV